MNRWCILVQSNWTHKSFWILSYVFLLFNWVVMEWPRKQRDMKDKVGSKWWCNASCNGRHISKNLTKQCSPRHKHYIEIRGTYRSRFKKVKVTLFTVTPDQTLYPFFRLTRSSFPRTMGHVAPYMLYPISLCSKWLLHNCLLVSLNPKNVDRAYFSN